MPLAFDCISHGSIAFGFFNIESDMLLLDRCFFFATEFCENISRIAEYDVKKGLEMDWQVYRISDPQDIGDLMAAIHGEYYTGFIGETYRKFPFPEKPEDFKQKPYGLKNQSVVESIIEKYARHIDLPFVIDKETQEVGIGVYRFTMASFQELIQYVWQGGYPRWEGEVRPDYVLAMKDKILQSHNKLLRGIVLQ